MHKPWCWAGFSRRSDNLLATSLGGFSSNRFPQVSTSSADLLFVGPMKDFFFETMLATQQDHLRSFRNIIKACVLWNKIRILMWLWLSQQSEALLVYCTQFSASHTFHRVQKCVVSFFNNSYRKSIDFMSSINPHSCCARGRWKQRHFPSLTFGTNLPHCCL